jgi:NAD-dependent SIR2 family protein deacetylase
MLEFQAGTKVDALAGTVETSFPDFNEAIATACTSLNALSMEHHKTKVIVMGRIKEIIPITNSALIGKVTLYDESDQVVDLCIFSDQKEFMDDLEKHQLVFAVATTSVRADETTSLAMIMARKNFLNNFPSFNPLPRRPMADLQLLPNQSVVETSFFDLMHNKPEKMAWLSNQTMEVLEVTGDYVNFHCPTCAKPLEIREQPEPLPAQEVWACEECGDIEDKNVVFKSRPTLRCVIEGVHIECAQVKEGMEQILLGKSCDEIVESNSIVDPANKIFLIAVGVSMYRIMIVRLYDVGLEGVGRGSAQQAL